MRIRGDELFELEPQLLGECTSALLPDGGIVPLNAVCAAAVGADFLFSHEAKVEQRGGYLEITAMIRR